jgi:hypothetical protein
MRIYSFSTLHPIHIVRVKKSRRMRWAGRVAHMENTRNAYKILVGKFEGKRPLERSRYI